MPIAPIHCHYSKSKILGYLLLGCLMTAAAYFCTTIPKTGAVIAGWAGLLFFGGASIFFVTRFFCTGPVVIINEEGIHDKRWKVGTIRWCDIEKIMIQSMNTRGREHRFIALILRDTAPYDQKRPLLARFLATLNQLLGFSPYILNCRGLEIDDDHVIEVIQLYHRELCNDVSP